MERIRTHRRIGTIDVLLVVVLIAIAAGAYLLLRSSGEAQAATNTATVQRGTVEVSVSASGTVESTHALEASFVASGTVSDVLVHVGDHVKEGDVMARLRTPAPQRDVVRLEAPMSGTVTEVNLRSRTTVGSAGTTSVSAVSDSGDSSSTDTSTSSTSSASIVVTDLTRFVVRGYFAETDASKLSVGEDATVTFDAVGTSVDAVVTGIDTNSTTVNNVVEYGVTLRLDRFPHGIRQGQTATVEVVTERATDALTVPLAAVQTQGGRTVVTVLRNGRQLDVSVTVGVEGDQTTEITSGLSAGDRVVIPTTTGSNGFPGGGFPGVGLGGN